ncbi:MAG: helix-turn-helix transcriptional regulator [Ruminococcaceae bacterium]|nr:helix-turn-helix transcriptional regulator [Oscillospiraceae bacterium]
MTPIEQELATFCYNVALLRRYFHLTQKEMADALEISVYSLRKLERGMITEKITLDLVYYLNVRFGVPYTKLFSREMVWDDLAACKFDPSAV